MNRMIFIGFTLYAFAAFAQAGEAEICEKLSDQAFKNCSDYLCVESGLRKGCELDGEAMEGVQICVTEGELESLIKAHNRKNPRARVKCEDF